MPTDRLDAAEPHQTRASASTFSTSHRVHTARLSALPHQFEGDVPICARQCLSEYIEEGWTCLNNNSECLCSQYSSQGFTLGELAYICLQQECETTTHGDAIGAYQICSQYSNAVTATHSTLTVPASTTTAFPPTSTADAAGLGSSSLRHSQSLRTLSTRTATAESTNHSSSAEPGAMASTASSTTSAAGPAGDANGSQHSTSLTPAQAIGISVASMGVVVVAIGVLYLIICLRRRQTKVRDEKQERDSYDFVDEAPPRFSPFHFGYADPRGPLGGFYGQRAELTCEKRNSKWYREHFLAEPVAKFEKGFDYSPKSLQSMSTISQLLPDKPKATPPQLRTKASPRPPSNLTARTVFEEDRSPQMFSALFPPVGLPANPKAFHQTKGAQPHHAKYAGQLTQSPVSMRQPSLSIEIPKQAGRVVKSPAQAHVPGPHLRQRSPVQRARTVSDARSSRSAGSFLNYYASPEADDLRSPQSPTPIDDNAQTRRAVPTAITVTKPTYPPRAVRVTSGASDTSFESTDPDEPTPPEEEDRQLTPVKEHSPIAGIKYPKVPRSSNQAIPRSPPIGTNISPSVKSRSSPAKRQAGRAYAPLMESRSDSQPSSQARPPSQIPRKPLPCYQPQQQYPVTPEQQTKQNSSLSGSTLAAKRRGDTAAHDLEQKLHIKNSSHSSLKDSKGSINKPLPPLAPAPKRSPHNSPLKGYGRVASRNNSPVTTRPAGLPQQAQRRFPVRPADGSTGYRQPTNRTTSTARQTPREVQVDKPVKTPLWEPKLTPSRRGEDLYLQVGSATPRTEAFSGSDTAYRGRGM